MISVSIRNYWKLITFSSIEHVEQTIRRGDQLNKLLQRDLLDKWMWCFNIFLSIPHCLFTLMIWIPWRLWISILDILPIDLYDLLLQFCSLTFLSIFFDLLASLTGHRLRGGVTPAKGPRPGHEPGAAAAKGKASVHGTLPTELNSIPIISIFCHANKLHIMKNKWKERWWWLTPYRRILHFTSYISWTLYWSL